MDKLDYKKAFKELYLPKKSPSIIDVPQISYAMIEGKGDPNGEEFSLAIGALYSLSYTVKMSYKSTDVPQGFYDYVVFPLEGVWDLTDKNISATDKSNFAYTIMIRQPDFLTESLFERFITEVKKKKPNPYLDKVKFGTITEGLCCQMLHIGSYEEEQGSFELMERFCKDNRYERISEKHREIYLSDPRKTEESKLKTVLRYQVKSQP